MSTDPPACRKLPFLAFTSQAMLPFLLAEQVHSNTTGKVNFLDSNNENAKFGFLLIIFITIFFFFSFLKTQKPTLLHIFPYFFF
jgi:hypothetical protein